MSLTGIIYDSSWNRPSGAVWLDSIGVPEAWPPRPGRIRSFTVPKDQQPLRRPLRLLSNALFLTGAAGLLLTMLPVAAMEVKYRLKQADISPGWLLPQPSPSLTQAPSSTPPPLPANEMEAFSIHIPKIDAHSQVLANIDASDPDSYAPALKKGVAHALGTGLPGVESEINRTIYLFAHSTSAPSLVKQYNAQFYLLHQLEIGDELSLTFWTENYHYRVRESKIVDPSDVTWLRPQTEEELLVLATCTPPGTTWKRLLIIAERV